MAEIHSEKIKENDLDTILGEDIDFKGSLVCKDPVMIKGNFIGDIKSNGKIFIGETAVITGNINAVDIKIRGEINGDIEASQTVQLFASAKVTGDIRVPKVKMENGCYFSGQCYMIGETR